MPKRTNDFQQLVLRIYQQLSATDATVEESAMLKERDSDDEREVDILLEKRAFGTTVRIAVECRDHGRKATIQWIDALIGQYRDLPVDKVIAVHRAGFSAAAAKKANANRIDTLTLEQALETDWPTQFIRLGVANCCLHDKPHAIKVETEPVCPFPITEDTTVYDGEGQEFANVGGIWRSIYDRNKDKLHQTIGSKLPELFKTVGDMNTKSILSDIPVRPPVPMFLKGEDGTDYRVKSFMLKVLSSFSTEKVNTEHFILGEVQVSVATVETPEDAFSIMTVQVPEAPNTAKVHVAPVKQPKKLARKTGGKQRTSKKVKKAKKQPAKAKPKKAL